MDICDKTVLMGMLAKISEAYNIDYDEMVELCGLSYKIPSTKPLELEHICIDGKDYLYDFDSHVVYTRQRKSVKKIGILCSLTNKVIRCD